MSVTFSVAGQATDLDDYFSYINLCNRNAQDLCDTLDIPKEYGEMKAVLLFAKCRAWEARKEHADDVEIPTTQDGNFISGGREAGYLRHQVGRLAALCEMAGDLGSIQWG